MKNDNPSNTEIVCGVISLAALLVALLVLAA